MSNDQSKMVQQSFGAGSCSIPVCNTLKLRFLSLLSNEVVVIGQDLQLVTHRAQTTVAAASMQKMASGSAAVAFQAKMAQGPILNVRRNRTASPVKDHIVCSVDLHQPAGFEFAFSMRVRKETRKRHLLDQLE